MGCGGSKKVKEFLADDRKVGQGYAALRTFEQLEIEKKTIDRYYELFLKIDRDESHEIDLDEFYRFFDIERSPFSDRIFSIMDEDGSGEIDFREFVVCLWNYLSFDTSALIKFAFTLFDLDGSGQLDVTEVRELVMEVYGDAFEASYRVQRILDRIDADGDGEVSYAEFRDFNRKYPAILFPAFRMQQEMRRRVFGEAFWTKELEKRAKKGGGGAQPSIWEILNAMDAEAYQSKMSEMLADEVAERWEPDAYGGAGGGDGSSRVHPSAASHGAAPASYGFDTGSGGKKKEKRSKRSRRSGSVEPDGSRRSNKGRNGSSDKYASGGAGESRRRTSRQR